MAENKLIPLLQDRTGLTTWYRLKWRSQYMIFTIWGSADRQAGIDPRAQLRKERAGRIVRAHEDQGTEASAEIVAMAQAG